MPLLSNDDLAAIRARCDAAPPGPWRQVGEDKWRLKGYPQVEYADEDGSYIKVHSDNDASFIAASRTDIPALLTDAEEARRIIGTLRNALRVIAGDATTDYRRRNPLATLDLIAVMARAAMGRD